MIEGFKVGDRVEYISMEHGDKVKFGERGTCQEDSTTPHVLWDSGLRHFMRGHELRLVPPPLNICAGMTYEEAQQLKPGDRVKVLFAASPGSYCPHSGREISKKWEWCESRGSMVGGVFEVESLSKTSGFVFLPSPEIGTQSHGFPWFCLQLVEKSVEEMTLEQVCKELGRDVKIVRGEG
jgi:hypothetical protein